MDEQPRIITRRDILLAGSVGLLAADQASRTAGSITGPVSTSESHSESNPRSSIADTSSPSASGVDAAPAAPTPMRIFMERV